MNPLRNAQLRHDNATPPEASDAEEKFVEDYTERVWEDGAALAEMAACSRVWGMQWMRCHLMKKDHENIGRLIIQALEEKIRSDAAEAYDADCIAREDALGDIQEGER